MLFLAFILSFSPLVDQALEKIYACPEMAPLIQKVNEDGGFTVRSTHEPKQFMAYWDGGNREILVSLPRHESVATIISSIVFELHNAHRDDRLRYLAYLVSENKLTRQEFIRKVERMEFSNWNHAYEVLEKGMKSGIFPRGSGLPNYFDNFHRYLTIQQEAGHSSYIGEMYDILQFQ